MEHHHSNENTLENELDQIDDPHERAVIIEEAYQAMLIARDGLSTIHQADAA